MMPGAGEPRVVSSLAEAIEVGALVGEYRPCLSCGYNLRSISVGGVCPECGAPAADSLRSDLLTHAPKEYVARLRRGAWLVVLGMLCTVLSWCVQWGVMGVAVGAGGGAGAALAPVTSVTWADGTVADRVDVRWSDGTAQAIEFDAAAPARGKDTVVFTDGSVLTVETTAAGGLEAQWSPASSGPVTFGGGGPIEMVNIAGSGGLQAVAHMHSGLSYMPMLPSGNRMVAFGPNGTVTITQTPQPKTSPPITVTLTPSAPGQPASTASPPSHLKVSPTPYAAMPLRVLGAPLSVQYRLITAAGALLALLLSSVGLLGWFRLTSPDPRWAEEARAAWTSRRVARLGIFGLLGVKLLSAGLEVAGASGLAAPSVTGMMASAMAGTPAIGTVIFLVLVWLASAGAWATLFVAGLLHVRTLARRIPDLRLARRVKTTLWVAGAIVALVALLYAAFFAYLASSGGRLGPPAAVGMMGMFTALPTGVLMLVAGVLYLSLFLRLSAALSRVLRRQSTMEGV